MESKAIVGKLSKMIPDHTTKLTKDTVDAWMSADASKPKVLVFSNKKSAPTMLKALSSDTVFKRTAKFGFVTEDEADVCAKFKVKKFPSVILQRKSGQEFKKETYSGAMNFQELHKFVNPYVESGVGDKVGAGAGQAESSNIEDDQPWLPRKSLSSPPSLPIRFAS